jgi:hypothetical protein
MSSIRFQHGPVSITVDGLPDRIAPDSVKLSLGIHSNVLMGTSERVAEFAEAFTALGGVETFPLTDPAEPFSVAAADGDPGAGFWSELRMYPPGCSDSRGTAAQAILAALDVDRHARVMRNNLTAEGICRCRASGADLSNPGLRCVHHTSALGCRLESADEPVSVRDAITAERSRPVVLRQGGMPVASECERGCVCEEKCGEWAPCEMLRP